MNSGHRKCDTCEDQSSRELRVRDLSHYWSASGKDLMSLSLSFPTCTMSHPSQACGVCKSGWLTASTPRCSLRGLL